MRLDLTDSHRRWVGSVTQHMRDVIEDLRRCGVAHEQLAELKRELQRLEDTTQAARSQPRFLVNALLMRLWVDACELAASSVESYGALGDAEHRYFDERARELEACVQRLGAAIAPDG
jgi:hypothetical protein